MGVARFSSKLCSNTRVRHKILGKVEDAHEVAISYPNLSVVTEDDVTVTPGRHVVIDKELDDDLLGVGLAPGKVLSSAAVGSIPLDPLERS